LLLEFRVVAESHETRERVVLEVVKTSTVTSARGRTNNDSSCQRSCHRYRGECEGVFAWGRRLNATKLRWLFLSPFQVANPIFSSYQHLCIDRKEGEGSFLQQLHPVLDFGPLALDFFIAGLFISSGFFQIQWWLYRLRAKYGVN
jgi:hypothetical protein